MMINIRWSSIYLRSSFIMEWCLHGEIKCISVLWWTTLRKWDFYMLKTSFLSYWTGKKSHKEAKRLSTVTKAFLTFLPSQKMMIPTKRKSHNQHKKISKLEKYKKWAQYFVTKIQLISKRPKKFCICSERLPRMSLLNSGIRGPVMCSLPLGIRWNLIGRQRK